MKIADNKIARQVGNDGFTIEGERK